MSQICPNCKKEVRSGVNFCTNCGSIIEETQELSKKESENCNKVSEMIDKTSGVKTSTGSKIIISALTIILLITAYLLYDNMTSKTDTANNVIDNTQKANENVSTVESSKNNTEAGNKGNIVKTEDTSFKNIAAIISNSGNENNLSIHIKDLKTDKRYSTIDSSDSHIAAGTVYIPIMLTVMEKADDGYILLSDRITLYSDMLAGGTGKLSKSDVGNTYSIQELIDIMMEFSDNTAANILLDIVSGNNDFQDINNTIKDMGFDSTIINRKMMDSNAINRGIENYTSPQDLCKMMELINSKDYYNLNVKPASMSKIPNLPKDCYLIEQTGTLDKVYNYSVIVEGGDKKFIVCVFSKDMSKENAQAIISEIIQSLFEV